MSATTPKVRLQLSFPNETRVKLALSIPLDKCNNFVTNPLKWLRFLGFAIYGREGHLSLSKNGPDLADYTAAIEARSYFFVSQGAPRLVDVDAADDRTSIMASTVTLRRRDFRINLVERDGTCVISGEMERWCTACHIIPHAKGSSYISNVVDHRGRPDDNINDINDIRNGFLLANHLHATFGAGDIAFLKTPNFGLAVDDIPHHLPIAADEEGPASRLTLHHFNLALGNFIPNFAPHNSDARQPQETSQCPPALIIDLFYAAAAMNVWSPDSFIKYVREKSKDVYYPEGEDEGDNDVNDDKINETNSGSNCIDAQMGDQTTGQSGSRHCALHSRNRTSNIPPKGSRFADLMNGVCALWVQSSRVGKKATEDSKKATEDGKKATEDGKKATEDIHASRLSRNEGVKKWLESVEDPEAN
ncbi:hypothetical protein K443DRAFT_307311 [Laccaria amethystina LaAM-08-1]|uniref:HNH nuclease domain-containing protein n=1 Tax=Laccaria amethystina LaAM-08-1 TaxID=1095629 RepID=A0A0C9XLV6_9AGAR|nr:hypothetical protein K443DRAFT_307311 [Laccaria amethystina LaAM-08-1]